MQKKSVNIMTTPHHSFQHVYHKSKGKEAQVKLERLWHINPKQFDPLRNSIERERIAQTWNLIITSISLSNITAVDLGCGVGLLAERMNSHGAQVDAVDIAIQPLKKLQANRHTNFKIIRDYVPCTKLQDNFYKLVVSTDMIAYLPRDLHRLYFSELARLSKKDGLIVCSTPLDINFPDALERFSTLANTELAIERWILSHHALFLRIKNFLEVPKKYAQAGIDREYRRTQLSKRRAFSHFIFNINSSPIIAKFWSGIATLLKPLITLFNQKPIVLLTLEKICRFIWNDRGVSHVIILGTRRPIAHTAETTPKNHNT